MALAQAIRPPRVPFKHLRPLASLRLRFLAQDGMGSTSQELIQQLLQVPTRVLS